MPNQLKFLHPVGPSTFKYGITIPIAAQTERYLAGKKDDDRTARVQELKALFRSTQALPQIKAITDEMIAEEVETYRAGR